MSDEWFIKLKRDILELIEPRDELDDIIVHTIDGIKDKVGYSKAYVGGTIKLLEQEGRLRVDRTKKPYRIMPRLSYRLKKARDKFIVEDLKQLRSGEKDD